MPLHRILIVDDQQNWRDVISSLLASDGYEVNSVASTADAWRLLDNKSFDIAILDVRLVDDDPFDVQGIELLEQMKTRLGDRFPIVIMTGYSFEGLEKNVSNRYGVKAFLHKGSGKLRNIKEFRSLIKNLLANAEND